MRTVPTRCLLALLMGAALSGPAAAMPAPLRDAVSQIQSEGALALQQRLQQQWQQWRAQDLAAEGARLAAPAEMAEGARLYPVRNDTSLRCEAPASAF
ncbi:MAG TPA: hypothetical protein VFV27_01425 [Nevskiaceae bacterium]|nr:hypothetical protein [Nevskiaceae bacterium]